MKRIVLSALGLALVATASVTAEARSGGPGINRSTPRIDVRATQTINAGNLGVRPRINRDLNLHVRCKRYGHQTKLGVSYITRTCWFW